VQPDRQAQFGEDWDLIVAFNGLCNGTYIEMGALDGVRFSNSYVINKHLDFKGLLVELTPDNYEKAKVNRPNELAVVHAAVCSKHQDIHWVGGVGKAGAVNGVWEFASETFRNKWWRGIKDPSGLPVIKCLPLTDIMDQHLKTDTRVSTLVNCMPHYYFDFYSLDVEGAEWSVLNSIDWNLTAFGLLFLEAPAGKPEERQLIQDFMTKEQGYTLVGYKRSSFWFQHPEYARIYADVPALTE
jgi:hypothetical protein